MTFEEWYNNWYKELPQYRGFVCRDDMKQAWDAAIKAALEELNTHWYSKDKAQKAVDDLLTS